MFLAALLADPCGESNFLLIFLSLPFKGRLLNNPIKWLCWIPKINCERKHVDPNCIRCSAQQNIYFTKQLQVSNKELCFC